jgi:hypothetical protein
MVLDARIKAIEKRDRPPEPGDDILLSVITDGRHAAIDLRLVDADNDNEPDNKLNDLVSNAFRIWQETAGNTYVRPTASPSSSRRRADDLLRSRHDQRREDAGFSAYRWIRDELIRWACRPPRSPSCRTTRSRRPSSACSATCAPARSAS